MKYFFAIMHVHTCPIPILVRITNYILERRNLCKDELLTNALQVDTYHQHLY